MSFQSILHYFINIIFIISLSYPHAQELKTVQLPPPDTKGGKPLMQALKMRRSTREYAPDELPLSTLSNMLWAACGVNRPESLKRTAPSAVNCQEIDVFIATAFCVYAYDPAGHTLKPVYDGDIRAATGKQSFVAQAPVNLIYIADYKRMEKIAQDERRFYAFADAAFISQNVYLYCASENLATVIRGSIDRAKLANILQLGELREVLLAQSVGYPKR